MGAIPNSILKWSQLESRASETSRPQPKKSKTDSPPPLGDCWKLWVFSEILKVFNERRKAPRAGGIDGSGGFLNFTLKWPEQAGHSRAVVYGLSPATG